MTKNIIYKYLGVNGTIESPVLLEDTYYIRVIKMTADKNKILTNGIEQRKSVSTTEKGASAWREIPYEEKEQGQE